ncbi:hypothetical protein QQS21_007904 [Conoideocrella luteorostrata]|uniref:FAD/NAD(P)-binding domain-containing protein n=1 Tax=Conoideocrella luteorostrata TaxID=1105319 RepID=A0AAJ0CJV6_9HYPO|nr:hypothetical protein QQS21_007904 [Conoideocrella luteorostrata]
MTDDALEFYGKALWAMLGLALTRTMQQIQATGHRWTYRETENAKKQSHQAILVERNSHFNHSFVFPQYGIVPGREHKAFIPYDRVSTLGPPGILRLVRGSATSITPTHVQLASGETINYDYPAIATGSSQPPSPKATSTDKNEACVEMQRSQRRVQDANRIAVIGGGPVGVQIATDIAAYFP